MENQRRKKLCWMWRALFRTFHRVSICVHGKWFDLLLLLLFTATYKQIRNATDRCLAAHKHNRRGGARVYAWGICEAESSSGEWMRTDRCKIKYSCKIYLAMDWFQTFHIQIRRPVQASITRRCGESEIGPTKFVLEHLRCKRFLSRF